MIRETDDVSQKRILAVIFLLTILLVGQVFFYDATKWAEQTLAFIPLPSQLTELKDWNDYLPEFDEETSHLECKGSMSNSEFQLDLEGDDRTDKYRKEEITFEKYDGSLQLIQNCIHDLRESQILKDDGLPEFPATKPDIRIPFYVLPEHLPEEARDNVRSTSWTECWAEYQLDIEGSSAFEWIKRTYGYHAARQLENHPWRVANPDDALIYIIPWFDHVKEHAPSTEKCRPIFNMGRPEDAIQEAAKSYPDHLTAANTLLMMGDYFVMNDWFSRNWPTVTKATLEEDYRLRGHDFEPVISQFMRRPRYFGVRSAEVFNPDVISRQCYRDMLSPACLQIDETIERDRNMTAVEWKSSRPIRFSNFGKFDNRAEYLSRRSFDAALHLLMTNNIKPKIPEPFIHLQNAYQNRIKNELVSTCSSNVIEKSTDLLPKWRSISRKYGAANDLPSVVWSIPSERLNLVDSNKPQIMDLIPSNVQAELRTNSRFILSKRGDTASSQRSYEGFLYGSLTHHDVSEDLFSFYAVLPNYIPYRLTGIWDNRLCIAKLSRQLFQESGRDEIRFLGSVFYQNKWSEKSLKYYQKSHDEQWSDRDLSAWSKDLIDCHKEIFDLMELKDNESALDVMRHALYAYRDDIIWELPGSRVAENIIFETARLMDRHDPVVLNRFKSESPRHQTWESLNLTRESFAIDAIPKSCLLNGGSNSHDNGFGKWYKDLIDVYKKPFEENRYYKLY